MIIPLKAIWVVKAGLIPGQPMYEYDKVWNYTALDFEADGNDRGERYLAMTKEVHDYAVSLEDGGLNWVTAEYVWV